MENVQYISDLHLEYGMDNFTDIIVPNPNNYLILAGDISPVIFNIDPFLTWCSKNFKKVLYVPGNHEYWGTGIEKGKEIFKQICHQNDVIPLDNDVYETDNFRIIGSTLWGKIPENLRDIVYEKISDYQKIENYNVSKCNKLHSEADQFINKNLKNDKINIVATHHGPIREITSAPKYRGTITNCSYSSDSTHLVERADYWIFGHTHYCVNYQYGKCKVVSNCKGYPKEKLGCNKSATLFSNSFKT